MIAKARVYLAREWRWSAWWSKQTVPNVWCGAVTVLRTPAGKWRLWSVWVRPVEWRNRQKMTNLAPGGIEPTTSAALGLYPVTIKTTVPHVRCVAVTVSDCRLTCGDKPLSAPCRYLGNLVCEVTNTKVSFTWSDNDCIRLLSVSPPPIWYCIIECTSTSISNFLF